MDFLAGWEHKYILAVGSPVVIFHAEVVEGQGVVAAEPVADAEPVEEEVAQVELRPFERGDAGEGDKVALGGDIGVFGHRRAVEAVGTADVHLAVGIFEGYGIAPIAECRGIPKIITHVVIADEHLHEQPLIDMFKSLAHHKVLLEPLAEADDLGHGAFAAALRADDDVDAVEVDVEVADGAYVMYRESCHTL